MKKRLLFLITCCLSAVLCYGQTGSVSGRVTDSSNGESLIGVTILLDGTQKGTITDLDGNFSLKGLSPGKGIIAFSYIGYKSVKVDVEIKEGNTDVGEIKLESNTIALEEVQVFADIVDERKTPIAVSAINAKEIEERYSGLELPEMLNSTPGVYSNQGAGGFGDNEIYIRGFDQTNVAFMINGIPVNDMENGRMYWSNFAGISEATRQMQVQRGLGASKLAISSIGGTVNMISKPAERTEGGSVQYQLGNSTWNERLRFTYNTGELKGGWAVTFQGSRTTTSGGFEGMLSSEQGGYRPGAFVDAWSYYLAVSKEINSRHQLLFYAFGAPVNRGTTFNTTEYDKEQYGITDDYFNWAAGYYRGEFLNARQNKTHKPQVALSHYFDINRSTKLATSIYASFADVYSTQPTDNVAGIQNRLGIYRTPEGLLDFDAMAANNRSGDPMTIIAPNGDPNASPVTGYASSNYIEARYNNHRWFGLISTLRKEVGNLNIMLGVDLRNYKASHFARLHNALGGDFVINAFNNTNSNNLLTPNSVVREGDKMNYDYDGNVLWSNLFGQVEYRKDKLTTFLTLSGTNTQMWRFGHFLNAGNQTNSLGKSEVASYNTYVAKTGVGYSFTNRHRLFANVGYFTRPPFLTNSMENIRYSNNYALNLDKEKVTSGELGYSYRTSYFKANINVYYINWEDRAVGVPVTGVNGDEIFTNVAGLKAIHQGIEFDFTWNVSNNLEVNGFASLADNKWGNNSITNIPQVDLDGNPIIDEETGQQVSSRVLVPMEGLPVGNFAQHVAGLGFHYKGIKDTYIGARMNWAGKLFLRNDPFDVFGDPTFLDDGTEVLPQAPEVELDDFTTVDLYFGRYFEISESVRGKLSANINNLLNNKFVRWGSVFNVDTPNGRIDSPSLNYGFGTTYNIGFTLYF